MDLNEMMDNLVIDLKMTLDTEISTAEATRCIIRAVDDMSRTLPRERIYEHTWVEAVTDDSFTTPATTNATLIVNAWTFNGESDGATVTIAVYFLDVPRPLAFLITDANNSITRATITVKGTDADGVYREEKFYRKDGKSQTGKVYFSTIFQIILTEVGGSAAAGDTLSIGTAAPDTAGKEVWIQLTNPVKPGSESIYSGALKTGTKYTLDTDYHMDYANGRICFLSGGSMAVDTTYYANYDRAQTAIDISSIIPELIRITKVLYPADKIPEQSVAFSVWENMLTLGSPRPGVSQEAMVDKEHIAIFYEAKHAPPTDVGSGSYPEHLDQVVLIGAAGYALLIEAIQYEQQAVTDLAEIRTTLGYLGIGGASPTFLHALTDTALDKAAVLVTASSGKIDLALTKVALYLETSDTTDNAKDRLAEITDMEAYLRDLIIKLSDGTGAIADANAYLDEVDTTDLGQATVGAEGLLETGDGLINQLNDGENVPALYADYSRARVQIAQARTQAALGYFQQAGVMLSVLRSYIEESNAWRVMGETFIAEAQALMGQVNAIISEASTWIGMMDRLLAEAAQYQEVVVNDMLLSDRFRAEAQIRLNEFHDILRSKAEYRKRVVSVPVRQPK